MAIHLHRLRRLPAEHAQAVVALRQLPGITALHRRDLHAHVATALFGRLYADGLGAEFAALVLAGIAIVFVQGVLRLPLRIQIKGHFADGVFAIKQHRRIHRQNCPGTHKQRQRF